MNIESNIIELRQMPTTIKIDMIAWKQIVQNGGSQLNRYDHALSQIINNERLLINANTKRESDIIERRLKRLFQKVDTYNNYMQNLLEELCVIKDRTECMWQRLRLWIDDSCIQNYCMKWKLTTTKLVQFLEFLFKRYDYEWEVKEMVVLALENINRHHNAELLLQTWCNCQHAGGYEFNDKVGKFFQAIGVRAFIERQQQGNWNTLSS